MRFKPSTRGVVIERVGKGDTLAEAAEVAGVPLSTVKDWNRRGRRGDGGPYADFSQAIERARFAARRLPPVAPPAARSPSHEVPVLLQAPDEDEAVPAMTVDEFKRHLEAGIRNQLGWAAKLWSDRFLPAEAPEVERNAITELASRRRPDDVA